MASIRFNAGRVERALFQETRSKVGQMIRIVEFCGEHSHNRRMARRIGSALLNGCSTVVVPVCFIAGDLGRYCELTQRFMCLHREFLLRVAEVLPKLEVVFLVPEHEASNEQIQCISGKSSEELKAILAGIRSVATSVTSELGWKCVAMSEFMDDPVGREVRVYEEIMSGRLNYAGFKAQAVERRMISVSSAKSWTEEEAVTRTARAAAQYVSLGRFASEHNIMVCNHTTISLRWYRQTQVALLHNPFKFP